MMTQQVCFRLPNGDTFSGHLDNTGNDLVSGQYVYGNEDKYTGEIHNGLKHGHGTYIYNNTGEKYEGHWVQDLWEGRGTYTVGIPPQAIIKGDWLRGLLHGKAEVLHKNGDRFVGTFVNGKKEGRGEIIYANGTRFEGNFHNDVAEGAAKIIYNSPEGRLTFQGQMKGGVKCGHGTMTSA